MEEVKNKNTKYLASIGIEVPFHMPLIESLDEVQTRTAQDVAGRLCTETVSLMGKIAISVKVLFLKDEKLLIGFMV